MSFGFYASKTVVTKLASLGSEDVLQRRRKRDTSDEFMRTGRNRGM